MKTVIVKTQQGSVLEYLVEEYVIDGHGMLWLRGAYEGKSVLGQARATIIFSGRMWGAITVKDQLP